MGFIDKYVYFWQVRGLGKGQFTQFLDLFNFNFVALLLLLLKDYVPTLENAIWIMVILAILIETFAFIGGVILEKKYHLIHAQTNFSNDHNDAITNIFEGVKQLNERMRRMELKMK